MNAKNSLRIAASILALALAPALLAGCEKRGVTFATWKQVNPTAQPGVQQINAQHIVRFSPKAMDVTSDERKLVANFVREIGLQPGSQVQIAAPTKTPTQAARSANRLASVRVELQRWGIVSNTASASPTGSVPTTGDEVVIFASIVAVVPPDCPGYNAPVQTDYEYKPITNLGCSNAINLGLMVANPADLAMGRPSAPADGEAMALGVNRYRSGQTWPQTSPSNSVPFRIRTEAN